MKYVQFRRTINKGYLKIIPKPPTPGLGRAAVQLIACEDALLLRPAVLAHAIHLPAVAQHSRLARGEPWRRKVWRGRTKAEIHGNLLVNKGSLTFFYFYFVLCCIYIYACMLLLVLYGDFQEKTRWKPSVCFLVLPSTILCSNVPWNCANQSRKSTRLPHLGKAWSVTEVPLLTTFEQARVKMDLK